MQPQRSQRSHLQRSRALGKLLLDALFPHYCQLCDLPTGRDIELCGHCEDQLSLNIQPCSRCALPLPRIHHHSPEARLCPDCMAAPQAIQHTIAPFVYSDDMALLISRWKYGRDQRLGRLLAELWWRYAQIPEAPDLMLPVPLHWQRLLVRGFNQAEQLARILGRRHPQLQHVPLTPRLLRRRKATTAQAGLGRHQRQHNTDAVFSAGNTVNGLHIAVVDDVCTTGATANAIASVLRCAGAARVDLWCLARTPAPGLAHLQRSVVRNV